MKIITLIENLVYQSGLVAEHGLSFYIETESKKLLLDTGQSPAFLSNAKKLGIHIKEIDAVVISHGHYDHTGGLYAFLQENEKAKVFLKKEAFGEKYHHDRFVGTAYLPEIIRNRIVYVDEVTELVPGIAIVPEIPVIDPVDTSFDGFYLRNGDHVEPDRFDDELFLAITEGNKLSVLSSCSHRGITNILQAAHKLFSLPVGMITGGFHLKNAPSKRYDAVIAYFHEIKPENIGVCHCTGIDQYRKMKTDLHSPVFYNYTGNIISMEV